MKPFAQWVGDMAESIIDESHIGPHTHALPEKPERVKAINKYLDEDGNIIPGLSQDELYEHWMRRFDDEGY